MNDVIIELDEVYLKYKFLKSTAIKRKILNNSRRKVEEFEALHDVSFKLYKGETVGIVGSNGSGKSTLLRIIAGTLMPDRGTIKCKTDSISLLSLGVGFKFDLTGYENIFLSGLLLGLSKKEIDEKLDDIIDFSEISEFIHNPVRTYSSGMVSRLAFSISVSVNPELLLIDEIFSVGDGHFQNKSRKKIEDLINQDRTVVIVSHDSNLIQQYCSKTIWLEKGKIIKYGPSEEVVLEYMNYINK